jgi:hypothetical protein
MPVITRTSSNQHLELLAQKYGSKLLSDSASFERELSGILPNFVPEQTDRDKLMNFRTGLVSTSRILLDNVAKSKHSTLWKNFDGPLALHLHNTLRNSDWFSNSWGSEMNWWYFVSVILMPDVIAHRIDLSSNSKTETGDNNFYVGYRKNYFFRLWWVAEISHRPEEEDQRRLVCEAWKADKVVQVIERPGFGEYAGYHMEFLNALMLKVRAGHGDEEKHFRRIMKMHSALLPFHEPVLWQGGIEKYCEFIIKETEKV